MRILKTFLARRAEARNVAVKTWMGKVISRQPIGERLTIMSINANLRRIERDDVAHNAVRVAEATWAA